jgi:hypothetical protein
MSFLQKVFGRVKEALVGYASPEGRVFSETQSLSLADIMQLYYREPVCKTAVDVLAAATVGMGFYTTVNEEYERAAEAKEAVDNFNEQVSLDELLNDMAKTLIACGNDFWLKITPESLSHFYRLPVDAVEKIERDAFQGLNIPGGVIGYKLRSTYGGDTLKPEAVIHWRINCPSGSAFGVGVLQVLLHTLTLNGDRRPSYAWIKAKVEKVIPKLYEKWAGPDVLVWVPYASRETIKDFERRIKQRPEEGSWLFYGEAKGKGEAPAVYPVTIDPRSRGFEYYIEYMLKQFYVGCQSPVASLFSSPAYLTKATAEVAAQFQDLLIAPLQRYIKRRVEREIFDVVLAQAGFDPAKAKVRLNWGVPEKPEIVMADMLKAAELGFISREEFRKNAAKFGWELWEQEETQPETQASATSSPKG